MPKFSSFRSLQRAAECTISLKFGTEFDRVAADTPQTFNVKGSLKRSQRDERMSSKNYKSDDNSTDCKLGENYSGADRNV